MEVKTARAGMSDLREHAFSEALERVKNYLNTLDRRILINDKKRKISIVGFEGHNYILDEKIDSELLDGDILATKHYYNAKVMDISFDSRVDPSGLAGMLGQILNKEAIVQ